MNITFHKSTGIFHLYNNDISYLMMILPNGQIGQLYFGAAIRDREDFSHLLETWLPHQFCILFRGTEHHVSGTSKTGISGIRHF